MRAPGQLVEGPPIADDSPRPHVTELLEVLARSGADAASARDQLFTLAYDELRAVAGNLMRGERSDHTLRPTALVHEAYLRLLGGGDLRWENRAHFFAIAARAMRQVLVDHARRKATAKRGGGLRRVTWEDIHAPTESGDLDVLAFHEALGKLSRLDERMGRVVELRAFGGLTVPEIAHVLDVSPRTVDGDWSVAKRWLGRELA